jgi:feruloyl esterase
MKFTAILSSFVSLLFFCSITAVGQNKKATLENIKSTDIPNVTITNIEVVTAGTFSGFSGLPPFVRVCLISKPASESNIGIELWLPLENWNERFLGTGNGGGGGGINYRALADGLKSGFAVANTDMGTAPNARDAIGFPEKWKDFGYRATHEMTVAGKTITENFYGQPPAYSYFSGCSTGGQQALMEAQRFPEDYNGIIAGAPANNRTHLHTDFLRVYQSTHEMPDCKFTAEELNKINEAILKKNAGKDGGAPSDNFLTDPRMASFNFDELSDRLTKKQIETLKKIYTGSLNPATGERIYTPYPLGSENDRLGIGGQQTKEVLNHFYPFFWTFGEDFNAGNFDFDNDMDQVDSLLAPLLNANNPDLGRFQEKGGKLVMYTGTCDAIVPFQDALHYYERVVNVQGDLDKTQSFFRYFIVPGMGHCGGGPGLNECGCMMTALMNWVENGNAPDELIFTGYKEGNPQKEIRMKRPVYPYPDFPEYRGDGHHPALPSGFKAKTHARNQVEIPAGRYLK